MPDLAVELLSVLPWEASSQLVAQMQVGHVFLAGDAAHTMPPVGGFGLNTALQDAHNLAWKLATVLQGVAGPALLATYEAERLPVARAIIERAGAEFNAAAPDTPVGPDGVHDATAEEGAVAQLAAVLGHRYASSAVLGAAPPQLPGPGLYLNGEPGTRVPHVWLVRDGRRISSLDLCNGPFVLLAGAAGSAWCAAARALADTTGMGLAALRVAPDGDLQDDHGNWTTACGMETASALLIRPDGFVAWRSVGETSDPEAMLRAVFGQLLELG